MLTLSSSMEHSAGNDVIDALRAHQRGGQPVPEVSAFEIRLPPAPAKERGLIDFDQLLMNHRSSERTHMISSRSLPDGVGLLVDERLTFKYSDVESSCGLQIHRLADNPSKTLVVLSGDEHAYGITVSNARELLAMGITARFQLNPHDTIWVERYTADPESADGRATEEFWLVTFDSFNPRTLAFKHAKSRGFENLETLKACAVQAS